MRTANLTPQQHLVDIKISVESAIESLGDFQGTFPELNPSVIRVRRVLTHSLREIEGLASQTRELELAQAPGFLQRLRNLMASGFPEMEELRREARRRA